MPACFLGKRDTLTVTLHLTYSKGRMLQTGTSCLKVRQAVGPVDITLDSTLYVAIQSLFTQISAISFTRCQYFPSRSSPRLFPR